MVSRPSIDLKNNQQFPSYPSHLNPAPANLSQPPQLVDDLGRQNRYNYNPTRFEMVIALALLISKFLINLTEAEIQSNNEYGKNSTCCRILVSFQLDDEAFDDWVNAITPIVTRNKSYKEIMLEASHAAKIRNVTTPARHEERTTWQRRCIDKLDKYLGKLTHHTTIAEVKMHVESKLARLYRLCVR